MSSGFFAIRDERESINQEDLNKAVRKVAEAKKLEGMAPYSFCLRERQLTTCHP